MSHDEEWPEYPDDRTISDTAPPVDKTTVIVQGLLWIFVATVVIVFLVALIINGFPWSILLVAAIVVLLIVLIVWLISSPLKKDNDAQ